MPPKYTNKLNKNILQSKIEQVFWGRSTELQGWKWITVHLIKFNFKQDVKK